MEIAGYHVEDEFLGYKIKKSIQRLKTFEPEDGYYLAFSGGKDSQCIYHLAQMGGVKFEAEYRVTSVDPPELVHFIKRQYPDVKIAVPHDKDGKPITMWNLIPRALLPPTRIARYCCEKLKETGGKGRVTVTGVRWAESARRKERHGTASIRTGSKKLIEKSSDIAGSRYTGKAILLNDDNDDARRMVEQCFRTHKTLVNPIVDWEDEDVWAFLNDVLRVPHCELYDNGRKRIGCIACPMNRNSSAELRQYTKYRDAYLRAFDRMLIERKRRGLNMVWQSPEEVMDWWQEGKEWR